jgi:hypothetical protein
MLTRFVRLSAVVLAGSLLVFAGAGAAGAEPSPAATGTPAPGPAPGDSGGSTSGGQDGGAPAGTSSGLSPAAQATPTSAAALLRDRARSNPDGSKLVGTTMAGYARFYRPTVRRGTQDGDVYHIRHVRELQYRLRWSGAYTGPVTGNFGPLTEAGVKAFQTRHHLAADGVADLRTWQSLITVTVKGLSRVPPICRRAGWHSCYDRSSNQLFGYYNGTLWNVWLVRGGAKHAQTDPGSFTVFARYVRKNSSIYGTLMHYFQKFHGGEGVHGSITMIDPFVGHSHGCVNMYIEDSKVLWDMTAGKTHAVTVYGAWA